VTASPATRHQQAVTTIVAALHTHLRRRGGWALAAPMDVWFSDGTVLEPDVLAVLPGHLDRLEERRVVGPPDLVVEVSSPSTRRTDQIQCHRLGGDGTYGAPTVVMADGRLASSVLDGFAMPATDALVVAAV
jgi:Uma2 family endonuclease